MSPDELRLRSLYVFLSCSQAVEQCKDQLIATFPSPTLSTKLFLEQSLRRELAMLFRYWMTREIWERLETNEEDAKHLNLVLLRLFTNAFRLPRDGSGLRYASLAMLSEEVLELSHRITSAIGMEHQPLLAQLQSTIAPWRDSVIRYTADALTLPLDQLAAKVKALAELVPGKIVT